MSNYDHTLEIGDRVKCLIDSPDIKYSGQRGIIIGNGKSGFLVEFDNPDFGSGWFVAEELRKVKL